MCWKYVQVLIRSIFFSLVGVYDDLQPTELNVKSGDCFLPKQKSTVLTKETETPKGDEANVKKTVKVKENSEPRPSMLSSAARVSTSGTLVQDTCLRKRHRNDQRKGFSCDSKTADPLSMPTADKGGPIRHHQSPLPPIFARLSTSEVGRAKKDDDWLVRNQGNFLPFSQKAGGFDYDPDRTLHESHLEEKDEKYFAMKGNSSFEAEKDGACRLVEEDHSKYDEKSHDESSVKKMSSAKIRNSSKLFSDAEKADACRSKEESHPSCKTNDEKSSAKKENSSLETAKEEQGFFGKVFWAFLHHAPSKL